MPELFLAVALVLQAPPAQDPKTEITEKEAIEFARTLEQGLLEGKPEAFDSVIDLQAIFEETVVDLDLTEREKAAFRRGMSKGANLGKQLDSRSGGSFRFLRQRLIDAHWQVLFRHFRSEGFNYHEFRLRKTPKGEIRIVDIYTHLNGEWITTQGRRSALSIVAEDPARRGKLQQRDVDRAEHALTIFKLQLVSMSGNPAEAQALYNSLPETMKQEKVVQLLMLQAARRLGPTEFVKAEEEYARRLPGDASKDMIGMYAHYHRGQYEKTLQAIDNVDRSVGGDPLLDFLRGNTYLKMGKLPESKKAGQSAVQRVPYLLEPRSLLVRISLQEKAYSVTVNLLRAIETDFEMSFENLEASAEYSDFVKSPEYRDWMKARAPK